MPDYEVIRPIVLFAETAAERSRQTPLSAYIIIRASNFCATENSQPVRRITPPQVERPVRTMRQNLLGVLYS